MEIWCCGCQSEINARLTDGREMYPHREDLYDLPFWVCDTCKNFVGCHHKTKDRTRPLGVIATQEIKRARQHIHCLIDPVWKSGAMPRGRIYGKISKAIGYEYHSAEIKTIEDARNIYKVAKEIIK